MSFIPAFEIGLCNAWVLMIFYFLIAFVPYFKKLSILVPIFNKYRHRHSLCFLGFSIMCDNMHNFDKHFDKSRKRICIKKYGNAYQEYMNRVSRWTDIPKSRKRGDKK